MTQLHSLMPAKCIILLLGAIVLLQGCARVEPSTAEKSCHDLGGVLIGTRQPYEVCIKRDAVIYVNG